MAVLESQVPVVGLGARRARQSSPDVVAVCRPGHGPAGGPAPARTALRVLEGGASRSVSAERVRGLAERPRPASVPAPLRTVPAPLPTHRRPLTSAPGRPVARPVSGGVRACRPAEQAVAPTPVIVDDVPTSALIAVAVVLGVLAFVLMAVLGGPAYL